MMKELTELLRAVEEEQKKKKCKQTKQLKRQRLTWGKSRENLQKAKKEN